MTPEQLELVAATAAQVELRQDRFATAFYDHLFATAPGLRALFPDDLTAQRAKLADELVYLAQVASDFDGFVERARRLGARHRRYGVRTGHYAPMLGALMAALAAVLGEAYDEDVAAAWTRLYRLLTETMMEGASSVMFAE